MKPNMATRARILVPARLIRVERATMAMAMAAVTPGVASKPSSGAMNGAAPAATAAMLVNRAQP